MEALLIEIEWVNDHQIRGNLRHQYGTLLLLRGEAKHWPRPNKRSGPVTVQPDSWLLRELAPVLRPLFNLQWPRGAGFASVHMEILCM
jgi:hypothetical protein